MLDLPMTITGDRADFDETLVEDLAQAPLGGLPVRLTLTAEDAAGQTGVAPAEPWTFPRGASSIRSRRRSSNSAATCSGRATTRRAWRRSCAP